jgi:acyl carrier protein
MPFFIKNAVIFQKSIDKYEILLYYKAYVVVISTSEKTKRRVVMFENLKAFLVEELRVNPDDVTMDAELAGDLGINSLELADLVYLCEEKFNVVIDDEDLHQFNTVGDVVRYLESEAK